LPRELGGKRTQALPAISVAAVSRTGVGRETNQDTVRVVNPDRYPVESCGRLYCLADGMGGYTAGDEASTMAAKTLIASFYSRAKARPEIAMRAAMEAANETVYATALERHARMGTTLIGLHLEGSRITIGHIGDSRLLRLRQGEIACLTRDHTPVGDLAHMNLLTDEQVRQHQGRSVLNRCLGIAPFVRPDIVSTRAQAGDMYILCSDGFWSALRMDEIRLAAASAVEHAQATGDPPGVWVERLGQDLVRLARDQGSEDDRSVVVIWVRTLPPARRAAGRWPGRLLGWLGRLIRHAG